MPMDCSKRCACAGTLAILAVLCLFSGLFLQLGDFNGGEAVADAARDGLNLAIPGATIGVGALLGAGAIRATGSEAKHKTTNWVLLLLMVGGALFTLFSSHMGINLSCTSAAAVGLSMAFVGAGFIYLSIDDAMTTNAWEKANVWVKVPTAENGIDLWHNKALGLTRTDAPEGWKENASEPAGKSANNAQDSKKASQKPSNVDVRKEKGHIINIPQITIPANNAQGSKKATQKPSNVDVRKEEGHIINISQIPIPTREEVCKACNGTKHHIGVGGELTECANCNDDSSQTMSYGKGGECRRRLATPMRLLREEINAAA